MRHYLYSTNPKAEAFFRSCVDDLLTIYPDNRKESLLQCEDYYVNFPGAADYNIAQFGNVLIYYDDVREVMRACGYKVGRYTDSQIWDYYRRMIGAACRWLLGK